MADLLERLLLIDITSLLASHHSLRRACLTGDDLWDPCSAGLNLAAIVVRSA